MRTAVLSVLALQWKFSERRKKKSRLINQSVCARVMCATPPHVASISALYSVPPLLYPLQKLVTTEDVFVVQNKSFHIEIYIRFVLTFFFSFIMTRNTSQQKIQFCAAVVHTNRYSTTVVVC